MQRLYPIYSKSWNLVYNLSGLVSGVNYSTEYGRLLSVLGVLQCIILASEAGDPRFRIEKFLVELVRSTCVQLCASYHHEPPNEPPISSEMMLVIIRMR